LEIEVNWRLIILLIILAVIVLAGLFLVPHFWTASQEPVAEVTPTVIDKSPVQEIVAKPVDIEFRNESEWQVDGVEECLPKLKLWLSDRYPLTSLTVVLTDTVRADMVLIVQQSAPDTPEAEVAGVCEEKNSNELICTTAVKQGVESENLDVAMTVEVAWLIQEFYRPKTKESWEKLQSNQTGLEMFQPLIIKENDQWVSDCLHLAR